MTPVDFKEGNKIFGPPEGFTEGQVKPVRAYHGTVRTGSCEGAPCVVVAYQPDAYERQIIADGGSVFMTVLGGLPPHMLTTSFAQAVNPA